MKSLFSTQPEAAEMFLNSHLFLDDSMDGASISRNSFFGRYLLFSFDGAKHLIKDDFFRNGHEEELEQVLNNLMFQYQLLIGNLSEVVIILAKVNRKRVLSWLCQAVSLNIDKQDELPPSVPISSNLFFINLSLLLVNLARPLTLECGFGNINTKALEKIDLLFFGEGSPFLNSAKINLTAKNKQEDLGKWEERAKKLSTVEDVAAHCFFLTLEASSIVLTPRLMQMSSSLRDAIHVLS
mmetsp:Transcript_41184/g.62641  ORF Transcript_41184/g.62641 Transcript_41184/m.62641 type:complete len:239 (+) Transcript_41184:694-1410(+)